MRMLENTINDKVLKDYKERFAIVRQEIGKLIVGQREAIDDFIVGLMANGHILVEGVPGIAKTVTIRTLAAVTGCDFKRVQFTVDLLPTDITGITAYDPTKGFYVVKGPIFANFILADEINRAPPKCVLGDTPIITGNGEIADIKELVRKYNGKKTYTSGNEHWIVPKKPLKLMAFDLDDYKFRAEEVKYLYKQKTSEPYNSVELKSGRNIRASQVHPFFTLSEGRIRNIRAKDLKKGDCVLVPKRLRIRGTDTLEYSRRLLEASEGVWNEIKKRRELYDSVQRYCKEGRNPGRIRKELGIANEKDAGLMSTFRTSMPKYLDCRQDMFFSRARQFGQTRGVKRPEKVTRGLAQFMAILIAEGSISRDSIYVTMKDRGLLSLFVRLAKGLFGLEIRISLDSRRRLYRVAFGSASLVALLKALGYDPHALSGRKSIPKFILTASQGNVKEFLRLYYECDGCVSRDSVKVTTKSRHIANQISYLLLRMGLAGRIGRELAKTSIGEYSYKRRFYNIRLYGADLKEFGERIGFYSEEKSRKLSGLLVNKERRFMDLVPGMHESIRNIRKGKGLSHRSFFSMTGMHAHNLENPMNALRISHHRLGIIADVFGNDGEPLRKIIKGDFCCDFVKENRLVRPKRDYWLYDFSMKKRHSFVAGFGGIISHNTQSALLEAMGEKQVTIGRTTFPMKKPFFVLATQNPIETSGTYPLPEAQVDRFLFKIFMTYPNEEEEVEVMKKNISVKKFEDYDLRVAFNPDMIVKAQEDSKKVFLSRDIERYITKLVMATRYPEKYKIELGKYIRYGSSPRGTIGLYISSKAYALIDGKNFVTPDHVKAMAHNVLRHRIILNYEGLAEGISTEQIVDEIVKKIPAP